MLHGVLIVDKPAGITSHDVVDAVRRSARLRRVGHTGTLDPMATGVLPLCLGKATKIAQFLLAEDKEYEVEMRLGVLTDSQDTGGRVVETRPVGPLDRASVEAVFRHFTGTQWQVPPMVSAKHHQGQRLYQLARRGIEVLRVPRQVTVWSLELKSLSVPYIAFHVHCSKGTYIRTLCHDLGEALGTGAAMSSLVRSRCGGFCLEQAVPLAELTDRDQVKRRLRTMDEALCRYPSVRLHPQAEMGILNGRSVEAEEVSAWDRSFEAGQWVRVHSAQGELLAMAEAVLDAVALGCLPEQIALRPLKVLAEGPAVSASEA